MRYALVAIAALLVVSSFAGPQSQRALVNSSVLALGAVVIAVPIGTLLAILLTRFDLAGRGFAAAGVGVLLFLPLYVQLSGWDAALGKLGWYSLWKLSLADPFLAGMRGAIFVHAMAATPWVVLLVGIGLLQVDPAQEEAALLVAPPRIVLWRITLPLTLPFIVAAAIWTIVSTTSEMTVTNIYLINPHEWTFTERFYMRIASQDTASAAIAALPGILGLTLVLTLTFLIFSRLVNKHVMPMQSRTMTFSAGGWRMSATALMWLLVIVLLGVPIASLVSKAGFVVLGDGEARIRSWSAEACLHEVAAVPQRFSAEIQGTIAVAVSAASAALLVAGAIAWRARRGGWQAAPAIILAVLGLAIPGPLVGATLIQLLNHDLPPAISLPDGQKSWLLFLYDNTPLAPIIAQAIRALPLTIMLLWHSFATLSDDVLAAAALDGLSPWRVFWRIAVPQRWRAILASWVAAFSAAAGDLAWSHLVTPPGLDLLSRRVFGLVHSGVEEQVAAISLVVIVAYASLAVAVLLLLRLQLRWGRR
jgi:iron(III) transport system permease protein